MCSFLEARKGGQIETTTERRTGIARDRLEQLVGSGLTVNEIARALDCGPAKVRHWLGRHGLRTAAAEKAKKRTGGAAVRSASLVRPCKRHGEVDHVVEASGRYRCKRCRVEAVTRRRRKVKRLLVEEAGGACQLCGYDRFIGALSFHHVDPDTKRLPVSMSGVTLALSFLREEARRCVLLCANCHAEVEGGVSRVSLE